MSAMRRPTRLRSHLSCELSIMAEVFLREVGQRFEVEKVWLVSED
jgi:hypothetical protein